MRDGSAMKAPLISGANKDEVKLLAVQPDFLSYMTTPWEEMWSMLGDSFTSEEVEQIKELYPAIAIPLRHAYHQL